MPSPPTTYGDLTSGAPQVISAVPMGGGIPIPGQSADIKIEDVSPIHRIQDTPIGFYVSTDTKWREALSLIDRHVGHFRKKVSPGQNVYHSGQKLESLYVISVGFFKIEHFSRDGHASNAEVLLDGDWLGFDAISTGHHTCTATALDFGEVWVVNYQALLLECAKSPELLAHVMGAVGKNLGRCRDQLLSNGSLLANRNVAGFLVRWIFNLAEHGRRTDVFVVPLSRAEIGSFMGVRLETVCRALQHLARIGLIVLDAKIRRQFIVPNLENLKSYANGKDSPNAFCAVGKTQH